jgi:integrase
LVQVDYLRVVDLDIGVSKSDNLRDQSAHHFRARLQNSNLQPRVRVGTTMENIASTERMGRSDLTAHGFRSTFRDWAAECTDYSNEVVEMALAHTINNKVEAAYRPGDLFEKRRFLMIDWAEFCSVSCEALGARTDETTWQS